MKKTFFVLITIIVFLSSKSYAGRYEVLEISPKNNIANKSIYCFENNGVFFLNENRGYYVDGIAYTIKKDGGSVIIYNNCIDFLHGWRMSINNKVGYNFYLIFGAKNNNL